MKFTTQYIDIVSLCSKFCYRLVCFRFYLCRAEGIINTLVVWVRILVKLAWKARKMGSGCWTVEKRSDSRNDLLSRENVSVPETGCLSVVVLGASGDLAKKKTFPALFNLYRQVCWNFFQFVMDIVISFWKFHFRMVHTLWGCIRCWFFGGLRAGLFAVQWSPYIWLC